MRPKKRVVIYGATEPMASILRIVLDARGYAPRTVGDEAELLETANAADAVVLLGCWELTEQMRLEARIRSVRLSCGIVILPAPGKLQEAKWMAKLLDRLHLALIRKRGPVRGAKYARAFEVARHAAERLQKLRETAA